MIADESNRTDFPFRLVRRLLPELIQQVYHSDADGRFCAALAAGLEAVRHAAEDLLDGSPEQHETEEWSERWSC